MLDADSQGSSHFNVPQRRHRHMDDVSPPSSPSTSSPATPPAGIPLAGTFHPEIHHSKVPLSQDPHYLLRSPSPTVYSAGATQDTNSKTATSRHTERTRRSKSSKSKSRSGDEDNLNMLMRLIRNSSIHESAEVTITNLMESLRVAVLDRNSARAEVLSLQAQLNMYKWQMEQAQEEILRAQNIINTLVEEKRASEEREAKLRGRAREAEALIRIRDAHQEGFQRGLLDAQRLTKHKLVVDHSLYEDDAAKSTTTEETSHTSSRSHSRRRSEPATTSKRNTERQAYLPTVNPEPEHDRPTSPPLVTRPRASSKAAHITPFTLTTPHVDVVQPIPIPPPQNQAPFIPPPRPRTRAESRASRARESTRSERRTTPAPPPPPPPTFQHDSFIPSVNSDGRVKLPPPHSMQRPLSSFSLATVRAVQEHEQTDRGQTSERSSSSSSSTSNSTEEQDGGQYSPSFPFPRQDRSAPLPIPLSDRTNNRSRAQSVRSRASTRISEYGLLAPPTSSDSQDGTAHGKVEEWRNALGFVPYSSSDVASNPAAIPPPPIIAASAPTIAVTRPPVVDRREPSPHEKPPKAGLASMGLAPGINWLRNRFHASGRQETTTTVPQIDIEPPSHSTSAESSVRSNVNRRLLTPDPPAYSPLHADNAPVISNPENYEAAPLPDGVVHLPPPPPSGRRRGATLSATVTSPSAPRRRVASTFSTGTAPLNRPISLFDSSDA